MLSVLYDVFSRLLHNELVVAPSSKKMEQRYDTGFRILPVSAKNRNSNLTFDKSNLILISSYHRDTVAPKSFGD
jgi:hypothetical protein